MEEKKIYVVGHKNPDTDAICSAISYAALKNRKEAGHFEAKRAGTINNETAFVLDYFKVKEPDYLENVNMQVKDVDFRETPGVRDSISIKDAWKLMQESDVVTLPIVERDHKLEGIITINDIAKSYMDVYDDDELSKARTPLANIVDTLDGELVCGNIHNIMTKGHVIIAVANPDSMEDYIKKDDIVIVGDRYESQLCAIEMGASCLIISLGAKVPKTILSQAIAHECSIITTAHDTYTVVRLINQSIPVKHFMRKEHLITFEIDDMVESIQGVMAKKRHRDFPITDDLGNYLGMISRRNLLDMRKKQLILVDHNEKSQAVTGAEDAEIMEVVDHHRIGSLETEGPVYFRNQPVGCTCTIVYQMYQEQGEKIEPSIAGIMCAAILSDTLMFRSPTCTPYDEKVARELASIAGIELESFATEMFEAGSNLKGKSLEEIFNQDFKRFTLEEEFIGVGQISSMNQRELRNLKVVMQTYIKEHFETMEFDMVFFMLTDICNESSELLFYGEHTKSVVEAAFDKAIGEGENSVSLKGVVSRKKQVVPALVKGMGYLNQ